MTTSEREMQKVLDKVAIQEQLQRDIKKRQERDQVIGKKISKIAITLIGCILAYGLGQTIMENLHQQEVKRGFEVNPQVFVDKDGDSLILHPTLPYYKRSKNHEPQYNKWSTNKGVTTYYFETYINPSTGRRGNEIYYQAHIVVKGDKLIEYSDPYKTEFNKVK